METTNTGGSATYAEDFNFWPTFPPPSGISVTPYLEFNGVAQTPELQTAMGVDIKIQDVTFSPDYDILAYSQFFASGGGGNAVESVNGQTGAVSLSIGDLNNVTTNAPSDGDIIVYRTASGQFVLEQKPQAGTNPAWGDITGTLSSQTDLQSALDLKVNAGDLSNVATSGSYLDLTNTPTTITPQQAADITNNNAKISYTDAAQVSTNTSDISVIQGEQTTQDAAIALNTAKRSYPLADENKLVGIASGAEVNVKSDWNATSGDAEILNKPTIPPAAPVDSVNGKTGDVVLDADDIDDSVTVNKFASSTQLTQISTNQSEILGKVSKSGDTLTGALILHTNTPTINNEAASKKYVDDSVANAGGGDMLKSVYDQDNDGVVDNSEALSGQSSAYYLNRANHTGTQTAATISDFDTEVSNNTNVAANTAKNSYPSADATKLAGIAAGANVNVKADWNATSGDAQILNKPTIPPTAPVDSVNGKTGAVVINKTDVGLSNVDNTSDLNKPISTATQTALNGKATAAQGALADSAQQPPIEGPFVDGDKTKLDGIEANADVTDAANVTAAGALMDSEVTNLAQVKAFDSTDYATAAQGSLADTAIQPVRLSASCHFWRLCRPYK